MLKSPDIQQTALFRYKQTLEKVSGEESKASRMRMSKRDRDAASWWSGMIRLALHLGRHLPSHP
jgi:hypothetical protein